MNNEQIFKKAIEKADKNGYKEWKDFVPAFTKGIEFTIALTLKECVIFDHKFAEAFYPKGWTCFKEGRWQDCDEKQKIMSDSMFTYPKYIFHLMESVKEKDPIKYLEKFL